MTTQTTQLEELRNQINNYNHLIAEIGEDANKNGLEKGLESVVSQIHRKMEGIIDGYNLFAKTKVELVKGKIVYIWKSYDDKRNEFVNKEIYMYKFS